MKQTIVFSDFREAFRTSGRASHFSYEGLEVLFDYLEDIDPDYELDVIALCCGYSEDSWKDIASNYNIDLSECEDYDGNIDAVRGYLSENTMLCGETSEGTFVYQIF